MRQKTTSPRSWRRSLALAALTTLIVAAPLGLEATAAGNGVESLQAVSQVKASQANDEALDGADKQRDLVSRKRSARADAPKDAEAEDRMGNFEIQDAMSRYNQSEQTRSSTQKKQDDSDRAVLQKID
jgi:hypothetical protein